MDVNPTRNLGSRTYLSYLSFGGSTHTSTSFFAWFPWKKSWKWIRKVSVNHSYSMHAPCIFTLAGKWNGPTVHQLRMLSLDTTVHFTLIQGPVFNSKSHNHAQRLSSIMLESTLKESAEWKTSVGFDQKLHHHTQQAWGTGSPVPKSSFLTSYIFLSFNNIGLYNLTAAWCSMRWLIELLNLAKKLFQILQASSQHIRQSKRILTVTVPET